MIWRRIMTETTGVYDRKWFIAWTYNDYQRFRAGGYINGFVPIKIPGYQTAFTWEWHS